MNERRVSPVCVALGIQVFRKAQPGKLLEEDSLKDSLIVYRLVQLPSMLQFCLPSRTMNLLLRIKKVCCVTSGSSQEPF